MSKKITTINQFDQGEMYTLVKGEAGDGKSKSIEAENGKMYVYHGQNPRGIFFMFRDAMKRYNSL